MPQYALKCITQFSCHIINSLITHPTYYGKNFVKSCASLIQRHTGVSHSPSFIVSYSPDMPENEATFAITAGGIADAKE